MPCAFPKKPTTHGSHLLQRLPGEGDSRGIPVRTKAVDIGRNRFLVEHAPCALVDSTRPQFDVLVGGVREKLAGPAAPIFAA